MTDQVRIAAWSGPRNLSTAMMRSWENRADTEVLDEPLYAHYLAATGLDHPVADLVIEAGPVDAGVAIATCLQAPKGQASVSYQKHMAHHLLDDMDRTWLDALHHVLLVRHPARVVASYVQKRATVTLADIGLPQQLEIFERFDRDVPVIDTDEFLRSPEALLRRWCANFDLGFDHGMLSWPAGSRPSDGVWAPHWYDAVWQSTGFGPPVVGPVPEVAGAQRELVGDALEIYNELVSYRW